MRTFILLVLCALVVACAGPPTPTPIPPLDAADVLNTQYPSTMTGTGFALLKDGAYSEPIVNGSDVMITIEALPGLIAFGELNGDNVGDAAVVLSSNSGGSGSQISLVALINGNGVPLAVDTVLLGDRVKVRGVAIEDGVIRADLVTHAPGDAQCCPTVPVVKRWKLDFETLVQVP